MECGSYYIRALSSYALVNAYSGLSFDGARGTSVLTIEGREAAPGQVLAPGEITLTLRDQDATVSIVVEDNGKGLPKEGRKNTDARVQLVPDRIKYWMSVGALPSENVGVLLKKYMAKFEQQAAEAAAAPAAAPQEPAAPTA